MSPVHAKPSNYSVCSSKTQIRLGIHLVVSKYSLFARKDSRPRGYITFSMLNSAEQEIYPAMNVKLPHLRDLKQETSSFVDILVFMSI